MNTKFWLAVGVCGCVLILTAIYLLRTMTPDAGVLGVLLGVVTLVVSGYFAANVTASGQIASSTTTTETPGKTVTVDKPKVGEV